LQLSDLKRRLRGAADDELLEDGTTLAGELRRAVGLDLDALS
jgi:hypothetical protein